MRLMEGNPVPHLIAFQTIESFITKGWAFGIGLGADGQVIVSVTRDDVVMHGKGVLLHEAIDNVIDEWVRSRTAEPEEAT